MLVEPWCSDPASGKPFKYHVEALSLEPMKQYIITTMFDDVLHIFRLVFAFVWCPCMTVGFSPDAAAELGRNFVSKHQIQPVAPVAQRYHVTSDTLGREFDPGKRDFSH